uniref:Uncharacterized protein n=1 Tax=Rhizophora mucronata TaxID=61149 RepID=A0A2P2NP13_RHIMU
MDRPNVPAQAAPLLICFIYESLLGFCRESFAS